MSKFFSLLVLEINLQCLSISPDSAVRIATRPMDWKVQLSNPWPDKKFFLLRTSRLTLVPTEGAVGSFPRSKSDGG